jgi:hypothetical protein
MPRSRQFILFYSEDLGGMVEYAAFLTEKYYLHLAFFV